MGDLGSGWRLDDSKAASPAPASGNDLGGGWTLEPQTALPTQSAPPAPTHALPPASPAPPPDQPSLPALPSVSALPLPGPGRSPLTQSASAAHFHTDFSSPVPDVPVTPSPALQSAAPKVLGSATHPPDHALEVSHAAVSPRLPMGPPTSAQVRVVVSLPDKKVIVQDAAGNVLKEFPAFVGTPHDPTPVGQFRIIEDTHPDPKGSEWYYGGHFLSFKREVEPGGKAYDDYGFHGWVYDKSDDAEEKIHPGWKTTTHGCVQLDNKDIAAFASLVRAGDSVTILNKSVKR